MSPTVRGKYQSCVDKLNIVVEKPFGLSLHKLCRRLAEGDLAAEYEVGKHYDYGWGVERDPFRAAEWYGRAANRGDVNAQHALGLLNTPVSNNPYANPKESYKWYRLAAEQGHPSSQSSVGDAYKNGVVVPRNYGQAALWYRKAAVQGYGPAMNELAQLYASGLGVEKSLVEAYAWNNVAATQGWGMARIYRDKLEQEMTSTQLKRAQTLSMELHEKYGEEPDLSK